MQINEHGYCVDKEGKLIHRQVCQEHHGKFPGNWHVHHIDYKKLNNDPENLIALPGCVHWEVHRLRIKDRRGCEDLLTTYKDLMCEYDDIKNRILSRFPEWGSKNTGKDKKTQTKKKTWKKKKKVKNKQTTPRNWLKKNRLRIV